MEQFNCDYLHAIKTRTKLTNRPGFFRDSPCLGHSVPESRTLSSGRPNVPV